MVFLGYYGLFNSILVTSSQSLQEWLCNITSPVTWYFLLINIFFLLLGNDSNEMPSSAVIIHFLMNGSLQKKTCMQVKL